jgi:hydrogenase maturation protease
MVRIIGIGNALRHDDDAGLEVVRLVRARTDSAAIALDAHPGEAISLLDVWDGADAVVLVDALQSGSEIGAITRIDASTTPVPAELVGAHSTHAIGIAEAIELARALDRLPARVIIYAIEGSNFQSGSGLSPAVAAAIEELARRVLAEALELAALEAPPQCMN